MSSEKSVSLSSHREEVDKENMPPNSSDLPFIHSLRVKANLRSQSALFRINSPDQLSKSKIKMFKSFIDCPIKISKPTKRLSNVTHSSLLGNNPKFFRQLKNYKRLRTLGEGGFAKVDLY